MIQLEILVGVAGGIPAKPYNITEHLQELKDGNCFPEFMQNFVRLQPASKISLASKIMHGTYL